MKIISVLILTVLVQTSYSQVRLDTTYYQPPKPAIGWDSVRSSFVFTRIMSRAQAQGAFIAHVQVDTSGAVLKILVQPLNWYQKLTLLDSSLFVNPLVSILNSTKWHPGSWEGKPIKSWVHAPLVFYYRLPGTIPPIPFEGRGGRSIMKGGVVIELED